MITITTLTSCAIFSNTKTAGKLPIYGNWCGPNHPKKGTNPQPIDKTDLACKVHDLCYSKKGYFHSQCDQQLVTNLKKIQPTNHIEAATRKAIISYFKRSPKL